jgi:hypothetical protein
MGTTTTTTFFAILPKKNLTPIEFRFMKVAECLAGVSRVLVLDNSASLTPTCGAIYQHIGPRYFSSLTHVIFQSLPCRFVTQVSTKYSP